MKQKQQAGINCPVTEYTGRRVCYDSPYAKAHDCRRQFMAAASESEKTAAFKRLQAAVRELLMFLVKVKDIRNESQ